MTKKLPILSFVIENASLPVICGKYDQISVNYRNNSVITNVKPKKKWMKIVEFLIW